MDSNKHPRFYCFAPYHYSFDWGDTDEFIIAPEGDVPLLRLHELFVISYPSHG